MSSSDYLHRHPSGSGLYGQSGVATRAQAMRDARTLRSVSADTLVVAGVLGFVLTAGSLRTVADQMTEASFRASQTH